MDTKKLTNEQIALIAKEYNLEPDLAKAVLIVETGPSLTGFLDSGKLKILFEGHIMYQKLKHLYGKDAADDAHKKYPEIVYPTWTKEFYLGGEGEWRRLKEASKLHERLAKESTSWGLPQIMGFNYNQVGCSSVQEMINRMEKSNMDQLELFFEFIEKQRIMEHLRNHDWEKFTRVYNGPGQVAIYSQKLENTYNNLKGKV